MKVEVGHGLAAVVFVDVHAVYQTAAADGTMLAELQLGRGWTDAGMQEGAW